MLAFIIRKTSMKYFIKPILLAICFGFISCTDCDCAGPPSPIKNPYNVSITPKANFKINTDTIWISGIVSSKVFDQGIKDSIFSERGMNDIIYLYKFVTPTKNYNCVDAINKFELIDDLNGISFWETCENGTMFKGSKLSSDSLFYKYRLGLIPKDLGSYIISVPYSRIKNIDKNISIAESHAGSFPIGNDFYEMGFSSCGNLSWGKLDESYDGEYYFNVTN